MRKSSFVLAAVVLFTAACGSIGGLGDLGGILGSPSSTQASDVRGTVSSIDTAGRRIIMDVAYVNNLRNTQNAQSIYYDNNTRVEYQGQTYRVEDLERGDEISVRGHNDNGRYVAEVVTVTRNVRT
ncbi:MAG TPA: hypothetical protein VFM36_07190 [Thermoanaerobaculia bacterium]|nr:hypothetical protein [Thermoanaerobaculia bacterium]